MPKTARAALSAIVTLFLLFAVFPTSASAQTFGGNVGFDWKIDNAPAAGLTDIIFSTKFNPDTAHVAGNYVADQFQFQNQNDVGYMGLQPRANQNGQQILHAAFPVLSLAPLPPIHSAAMVPTAALGLAAPLILLPTTATAIP